MFCVTSYRKNCSHFFRTHSKSRKGAEAFLPNASTYYVRSSAFARRRLPQWRFKAILRDLATNCFAEFTPVPRNRVSNDGDSAFAENAVGFQYTGAKAHVIATAVRRLAGHRG